jgi:hypothetical protein
LISQQGYVVDRFDADETHSALAIKGVGGVYQEARCRAIADREWRHGEVEFVSEVGSQELGVHLTAAFHHEPLDAAVGEICQEIFEGGGLTCVDDGCVPEGSSEPGHGLGGRVDEFRYVARREKLGIRVKLTCVGECDLDR